MGESGSEKRRITLELSEELLDWIDGLKSQMGFRNRGLIVEQLLRELVPDLDDDDDDHGVGEPPPAPGPVAVADGEAADDSQPETSSSSDAADAAAIGPGTEAARPNEGAPDDDTAIVLARASQLSKRDQKQVSSEKPDQRVARAG